MTHRIYVWRDSSGEEAGDRHCLTLLGASRSAWLHRRHRVGRLTMPQMVECSVMAALA
jgi:hypothetical protein